MYYGEYWEAKSGKGMVAGRRYTSLARTVSVMIREEAPQIGIFT
jgi:hypothetical protein